MRAPRRESLVCTACCRLVNYYNCEVPAIFRLALVHQRHIPTSPARWRSPSRSLSSRSRRRPTYQPALGRHSAVGAAAVRREATERVSRPAAVEFSLAGAEAHIERRPRLGRPAVLKSPGPHTGGRQPEPAAIPAKRGHVENTYRPIPLSEQRGIRRDRRFAVLRSMKPETPCRRWRNQDGISW